MNYKKQNHYALINHRGRLKHYKVTATDENSKNDYDTRLKYIEYNPNHYSSAFWIKNGKDKIVKEFKKGSKEYNYFRLLERNFDKNILEMQEKKCKMWNIKYKPKYYSLGTSYILSCYKMALKITLNPLKITI